MKVILDTNVLVSGLFFRGTPYKILQGIMLGKYKMVVTQEIIDEYKEIIDRLSKDFSDVINADEQLSMIILSAEICQPKKLMEPVCEDPDDDMFIACAISSGAKIIVSGDKLLLKVSGYHNVQILKPKEFENRYLF